MKNNLANMALKWTNLYKDCAAALDNISTQSALWNKVASLSNCVVADALMDIIERIAFCSTKSNHEVICEYLNRAIKDLESGMSVSNMLDEYEEIYEVYYKLK